jgi:hypothetical protein
LFQKESINFPTTPTLRKISRRKSIQINTKNVEHGVETSNVLTTHGKQNSSTMPCFASFIGSYDTKIEYNVVLGEIQISNVRKVFVNRLKESCLQWFKDHLHFPFSKIPMHLQKAVIHDMKTKFGIGWSVNNKKKQMSQNCKIF